MTDGSTAPTSTPSVPTAPSTPTPVAIDPGKLGDALDAALQRATQLSGEETQYNNLTNIEQKIVALLEALGVSIS